MGCQEILVGSNEVHQFIPIRSQVFPAPPILDIRSSIRIEAMSEDVDVIMHLRLETADFPQDGKEVFPFPLSQ